MEILLLSALPFWLLFVHSHGKLTNELIRNNTLIRHAYIFWLKPVNILFHLHGLKAVANVVQFYIDLNLVRKNFFKKLLVINVMP